MNRINALLVDRCTIKGSKIKTFLTRRVSPSFWVWHYNSRAVALRFLKEKNAEIDVILLDPFIADSPDPKETYKLIRQAAGDIPVIVITDQKSHFLACEVTAGGAADVIVRERFETHPHRLLDAIKFSIIRNRLMLEFKEKCAAEVDHHKRTLHWMMGGYSVEVETGRAANEIKTR